MAVVGTRDFRTNRTKHLNMVKAGERAILKSRVGAFRIFPDEAEETTALRGETNGLDYFELITTHHERLIRLNVLT